MELVVLCVNGTSQPCFKKHRAGESWSVGGCVLGNVTSWVRSLVVSIDGPCSHWPFTV